MSDPTTTNPAATTVNTVINAAVMDVVIAGVETALRVKWPFLNWPIVSPLFDLFWQQVGKAAAGVAKKGATFGIIDLQIGVERTNYTQAEANLRAVFHSGDNDAIQKAYLAFKSAAAAVIHYDGSANV